MPVPVRRQDAIAFGISLLGKVTLQCLVVRMFRAGGEAEHLRHSTDREYRYLQGHGNVIRDASTIQRWTVERRIVAGSAVVDQLLQTGHVCHGGRQEEEPKGDARGGAEIDMFAPQPGVDTLLDERVEYDAGEGIDGSDGGVGEARVDHLAGLGDEVVEGLVRAEPVEGEE